MQCDCRSKVEAKLADHVQQGLPEGFADFDAKLSGYGFAISGNTLTGPFFIKYQGDVRVPKKSGDGMKRQKIEVNVTASYCPFCGKPAKPDNQDTKGA